jgi:transcriptional regulator with XRE-family HTH domain
MSMSKEQARRLGALISKTRTVRGLSIRELAGKVGVHHSWLAYLEQGRYVDPGPSRLAQIAAVLEIDPGHLERIVRGAVAEGLPEPRVYFRAKLALKPEEAERVMRYIERVRRAA